MENINSVQMQLMASLEAKLPPKTKMVTLVADVLGMSKQGAYKKVNGGTKLTLEEAVKLTTHLGTSIDQAVSINLEKGHAYPFYSDALRFAPSSIAEYWTNVRNHMASLRQLDHVRFTYLANETPFFHLLSFHHLLAFKTFNWNRTIWHIPELGARLDDETHYVGTDIYELLKQIKQMYSDIDSIEIWNSRMLSATYAQLKHWILSGDIDDVVIVKGVLDDIDQLIQHLQTICSQGFSASHRDASAKGFEAFVNDLSIHSEMILIQSSDYNMLYTMYDSPNYLRTDHEAVCDHAEHWLSEIIAQSNPLSKVNRSDRALFFKKIYEEYDKEKEKILGLLRYTTG